MDRLSERVTHSLARHEKPRSGRTVRGLQSKNVLRSEVGLRPCGSSTPPLAVH